MWRTRRNEGRQFVFRFSYLTDTLIGNLISLDTGLSRFSLWCTTSSAGFSVGSLGFLDHNLPCVERTERKSAPTMPPLPCSACTHHRQGDVGSYMFSYASTFLDSWRASQSLELLQESSTNLFLAIIPRLVFYFFYLPNFLSNQFFIYLPLIVNVSFCNKFKIRDT